VRRTLYVINLFITATVALVTYYNTPLLLSAGIPEEFIGIIYALGSLLGIISLYFAPKIFNSFGAFQTFAILSAVAGFACVGLAVLSNLFIIVLLFLLLSAGALVLYLLLDMFLEGSTPLETETGRTRAFFLTMANIAWVLSPFIAGVLSAGGDFFYLYIFTGMLFVPVLIITGVSLPRLKAHIYPRTRITRLASLLAQDKNVRGVFFAQFMLRFFFAIMVIYIPILFIEYVGFSLKEMGLILSIAMTAYLIELPLGKIADAYIGEKEMMILGFLIIGISTIAIVFIYIPLIWLWALVLFITRIGAALIDITTESYFFKHVGGSDTDSVGAFRALVPLASIIGPLLGSVVVIFLSVPAVFFLLGISMFLGVPTALTLKDSR